ncbi:hypothetical protein F5Y15DRAFT_236560 [Xylariaceae sp. FL0016]|nr:hypothetical protein F5Y15DRAFT_236560 [Xylariaceae sp. FL0016]
MVSFFGLKIGGEKKKKNTKNLKISAPTPAKPDDHEEFDERELYGLDGGHYAAYSASVCSLSQPKSKTSDKTTMKGLKAPVYANDKSNLSMTDLPSPHKFRDSSYSILSLKQCASNPNLGNNWKDSSSTSLSLVPPTAPSSATRPASPAQKKHLVPPLDVPSGKDSSVAVSSPISPLSATAPKSPLGQYELKLNLPDDATSLFSDYDLESVKAPEPLRIRKQTPSPNPDAQEARSLSPKKPPSPPQSVKTESIKTEEGVDNLGLEPPVRTFSNERPSSRGSNRTMPSRLKVVQNTHDLPEYGPTSMPSPEATPRTSDEMFMTSPLEQLGEPIIQTLRARRDTLAISSAQRRSMEMKVVEKPDTSDILAPLQRPKTSNGPRPERPTPFALDGRAGSPASLRSLPPFVAPPRAQSPSGVPESLRIGRPAAAAAPIVRVRPETSAVRRTDSEYHDYDDESDRPTSCGSSSSNYSRPPSPESPVLPLSGPLAGPMFPFMRPRTQPQIDDSLEETAGSAKKGSGLNPIKITSAPKDKEKEIKAPFDFGLPSPPPQTRVPPTPTSPPKAADWPLPSPLAGSFGAHRLALTSTSTSLPSGQQQQPSSFEVPSALPLDLRPDSPLEPLEPPRLPVARAESPTFRSFSRPWTPTTAEPLRRDAPKRGETVPLPSSGSGSGPKSLEPRGAPPLRSATVGAERGLRSPAIVGDDFGGGFI